MTTNPSNQVSSMMFQVSHEPVDAFIVRKKDIDWKEVH